MDYRHSAEEACDYLLDAFEATTVTSLSNFKAKITELLKKWPNVGIEDVAIAAMYRIQESGVLVGQLVKTHVLVVMVSLFYNYPVAGKALLKGGITSAIVSLSRKLLGINPTIASDEHVRNLAFNGCLEFLNAIFKSTNGVPWISEALQHGLLPMLLKATDYLKTYKRTKSVPTGLEIKCIELFIGDVLPQYLSFYSVVTPAASISSRRNATRARRALRSGPLKEKWNNLFALISERCVVAGLFSVRRRSQTVKCDNSECPHEDLRKNMLRCATCLLAYYCSASCQKRAWKEGVHKAKCKRQDHPELLFTLGSRDPTFLFELSKTIIMKNMPSICIEARRKYPRLPTEQIAFLLDFRVVPPKIDAFPLEKLALGFPQFHLPNVNSQNRKITCYSIHAQGITWYMVCEGTRIPALYNLLEALLRHRSSSVEAQESLNAAKVIAQQCHDMEKLIHSDLLSFLTDKGRTQWSSADAKDLIRDYPSVQSCLFPSGASIVV